MVAETRDARERELIGIGATDCIGLIRIYQAAIGTPNGQIPIPGIPQRRMIDIILTKEFSSKSPLESSALRHDFPKK